MRVCPPRAVWCSEGGQSTWTGTSLHPHGCAARGQSSTPGVAAQHQRHSRAVVVRLPHGPRCGVVGITHHQQSRDDDEMRETLGHSGPRRTLFDLRESGDEVKVVRMDSKIWPCALLFSRRYSLDIMSSQYISYTRSFSLRISLACVIT